MSEPVFYFNPERPLVRDVARSAPGTLVQLPSKWPPAPHYVDPGLVLLVRAIRPDPHPRSRYEAVIVMSNGAELVARCHPTDAAAAIDAAKARDRGMRLVPDA